MQRSRRIVLFVLTLAALGVSAAAAQAATWLPGPTLGSELPNHGDVTTDAAGVSTAVWPDDGSGSARVTAQRIAPDGTTGALLDLGPGDSASVGATAAGGAVATWSRAGAAPGETELVVRAIASDGTLGDVRVAAAVPTDELVTDPVGSVAPDGATVVAWTAEDPDDGTLSLHARRVAAGGALGALVDLGLVDYDSVRIATTLDGDTHLLWSREREPGSWEYEVVVARLNAAGALAGSPLAVSDDPLLGWAELGSGEGGAVATWFEDADGAPEQTLKAVRLPAADAVGAPVVVDPSVEASDLSQATATVAPDGTATIAWDERTAAGTPIAARQLAPDGSLGPVRTIAESPATLRNVFPMVRSLRDGSLLAVWVQATLADGSRRYVSRALAADATPAGDDLTLPLPAQIPGFDPRMLWLSVGPDGDGLAAVVSFDDEDDTSGTFLTARYVAEPDPGPGPGVDPGPGPAPGVDPGPGPAPGVDPGTGPGPVPGPGPGGDPVPPLLRRAPARLKLTKAVRRGGRVTVGGTLDRRASGRVTLRWSQKSGRRTVRRTVRARIARGRFRATIRLPRALAHSRAAGRLTVTYPGDADTRRVTAKRTVRLARRGAVRPRR